MSTTIPGKWVFVTVYYDAIEVRSNDTMPTNIDEAWEKTNEKWSLLKKVVDVFPGERLDIITGGLRTCGLCNLYNFAGERRSSKDCQDCPIYHYTGNPYCDETPNREIDDSDDRPTDIMRHLVDQEIALLQAVQEAKE